MDRETEILNMIKTQAETISLLLDRIIKLEEKYEEHINDPDAHNI